MDMYCLQLPAFGRAGRLYLSIQTGRAADGVEVLPLGRILGKAKGLGGEQRVLFITASC